MEKRIEIPNWMKKEAPVSAYVCDLINAALAFKSDMTLAEFAQTLDMANKQWSYERIMEAVKMQFAEGVGNG